MCVCESICDVTEWQGSLMERERTLVFNARLENTILFYSPGVRKLPKIFKQEDII